MAAVISLAAGLLFAAGDLTRRRAVRLDPLVLDAVKGFSIDSYRIETGVYYRWRIRSDGRDEYRLVAPAFFREIWIDRVAIEPCCTGRRLTILLKSLAALCIVMLPATGWAGDGSGRAIVPNERGDTLSVLSSDHQVVETGDTCARPRGILFNADRSAFFLACADDDLIAVYDTATPTACRMI